MDATTQKLIDEIKALREVNAQLVEKANAKAQQRLTLKVGEKGGISVYGLGRFPVTLYASQWERLLAHGKAITEFAVANAAVIAERTTR